MRGFTGVISLRFQPYSVVFLVPKPKNFSFQRWTISRTCAVDAVKKTGWSRSELRTLPSFLDVNTLVKVVFDYLMCFRGGESLVTIYLIVLETKVDESEACCLGCAAHRIIYSSIEVTEWCGGVVTSLHSELIEVDGSFVKSCGSSRLEAAKCETNRLQRSRQTNRGRLIYTTCRESLVTFLPSQLQSLARVNLPHQCGSPQIGKCLCR